MRRRDCKEKEDGLCWAFGEPVSVSCSVLVTACAHAERVVKQQAGPNSGTPSHTSIKHHVYTTASSLCMSWFVQKIKNQTCTTQIYWNWASYWISSQYLPSFRRWTNLSVLAVCQYLAICKRLAYIHLFPLWLGFLLSLKEEKAAMALYLLPLAQRQTSIYFTLSSPMMFSCSNVYTHVTFFSTGNLLHISTNNYSSYFFEYWRRSIGL